MKKNFSFFVLLAIFFDFSCSLDYTKEQNPENTTPEFIFTNAQFSRVEKNRTSLVMSASKIEQYKGDGVSVAKSVKFKTFDKEGKDETEGKCRRVIADTRKELYTLLGGIEMNLIADEMEINAESLKFDRKNEQITSDKKQKVDIFTKDGEITGIGFSASGVSKRFSFESNVSGTIETNEESDDSNEIKEL